ncbi:hypothetical protein LPB77_25325, partial [Escherichia coli]|nr:hypothetical protein [Escherichia coli]
WKGWAILLRQKQKKLIMLPSETMIWQPEFTDKTLSRKPGAVQNAICNGNYTTNLNGKIFGVTATSYRFGGQTAAGTRHLFGHIRNFRVWFKELNDRQIKEAV